MDLDLVSCSLTQQGPDHLVRVVDNFGCVRHVDFVVVQWKVVLEEISVRHLQTYALAISMPHELNNLYLNQHADVFEVCPRHALELFEVESRRVADDDEPPDLCFFLPSHHLGDEEPSADDEAASKLLGVPVLHPVNDDPFALGRSHWRDLDGILCVNLY